MIIDRPAAAWDAAEERAVGRIATGPPGAQAFDAAEFDELRETIGQDGVIEIIMIFETETRLRLRRLAAVNPDPTALVREMHTLKGAAGSVAAPHLTALGRTLEQAARLGNVPSSDDLRAIEDALEAWLIEAKASNASRAAMA